MTDQSKTQKTEKQTETLELNCDTIRELTEGEAEQAAGGLNPRSMAVGYCGWSAENCTLVGCPG